VSAPKSLVERVSAYMNPGKAAEKRASKLRTVSSAIVEIKRKGRRFVINDKGKKATVKVSGSRTKVTMDGKKVKRSAIKTGMSCAVTYEGHNTEAASVACKR
jgi:ribosomal protein L36